MPLHRRTLSPRRPVLVALVLLGALGSSTIADAQQVTVQQSNTAVTTGTVQQSNTVRATTTGGSGSSQQISQTQYNSNSQTQHNAAVITTTGGSASGTVTQTNVAQGTTTQSSTVTTGSPPASVTQTNVAQSSTAAARPAARPTESLQLLAGCSNVALSWAVGTPLAAVAAAVEPPHALASIFKQDAAAGRYRGYTPSAPAFANDYTAVEAPLEAVFLCVTQAATLTRPTG